MTDDETMRRCIGALLLEGETFDWQRCCSIVHPLGMYSTMLAEEGLIQPTGAPGRIYRVSEKGRQFFLADHSKKED